ncbi:MULTISPECIES: hypothetical protein [Pseudomonas]|nr:MULTISPECIES: hypothetical protein [Pseudomonas]
MPEETVLPVAPVGIDPAEFVNSDFHFLNTPIAESKAVSGAVDW